MVYQPTFVIPPEIAAKVATGEYILWGGVVRDAAGHIVKHLKPVEIKQASTSALSLGQKVIRFGKRNPELVVVGAVVAVASAIGLHIHAKKRRKVVVAPEATVDFSGFNASLSSYVSSLQEGNLSDEAVAALLESIHDMESQVEPMSGRVEFESTQFKQLVSLIRSYTQQLVDMNAEALVDVKVSVPSSDDDSLGVLKDCLKTQWVVLKAA